MAEKAKSKVTKPKQQTLPAMPKPGKVAVAIEEFFELKDDAKSVAENIKTKRLEIIREMKQDNVMHIQHQGYSFTINASETLVVKKEGKGKKGKNF